MSVRREEYIIWGYKLGEEFTKALWRRIDYTDLDSKYGWGKEQSLGIRFLTDGMSGGYTFFGYIKQLSDGWEENSVITEIQKTTKEQEWEIAGKFAELFPAESMPEIKVYHVPHYV